MFAGQVVSIKGLVSRETEKYTVAFSDSRENGDMRPEIY